MATSLAITKGEAPLRDVRDAKRQKLAVVATANDAQSTQRRSKLFAPFRTIGLVSPTSVPFTSLPLGKTTFQITTSIGRNLHTYDLKRGLHLLFISSPQTPEPITATVVWEKKILAAWAGESGCGVWIFQRGKKIGELQMPRGSNEPVKRLVIFGSWIVGCRQSTIDVWKSSNLDHYTSLYSHSGKNGYGFSGAVTNLPTYLNKIFAGKEDGNLEIWNISTGKLVYTILPADPRYGPVTALQAAPALSILAVGYASGAIVIQDVRADKELLSFDTDLTRGPPVTTISFRTDDLGAGEDGQSPGVMATASNKSGDVTFWDLNNGGRKMGVLRGAHSPPSAKGNVAGGITRAEFLPGQSVIVTSGKDNALKSWIFDEMPFSPIPRILHSRGGHAAPVSSLQFLPSEAEGADAVGKWLLSASSDRSFWGWSLRRDGQSTELSQGNIRKKAKKFGLLNTALDTSGGASSLEDLKAPKIISMACCLNRDGGIGAMPGTNTIWNNDAQNKKGSDALTSSATGWESVVTGHENDKFARTWFWGRKRAGRWKFETGDGANVSTVAVSQCGTFALVGSKAGGIDMYNLQSGRHRRRFPPRLTPTQAKRLQAERSNAASDLDLLNDSTRKVFRGEGKHTKAVTGIEVDSLNKTVISCGEDGKVKFWDFASGALIHELDWSLTSIRGIRFHRASDLIALSCDDGSLRVVDIETKKLVRELWGGQGKVLDFTFSNDGRWILSASTDRVVRVFDLATGHLIEAMRFKSQPIAIAYSTTGEYLATAHEDSVGVHIWNNRSLFTAVPTRQIEKDEIVEMEAPKSSGEGGEGALEAGLEPFAIEDVEDELAPSSVDQLSRDLLTLSLVPKAQWQTLLHLDIIQQRNKPKEPPKKPQSAPFFLPSLGEAAMKQQSAPGDESTSKSRISKIEDPNTAATTSFTAHLRSFQSSQDSHQLVTHLSSLPPSAIDIAIRTLDPSSPYTEPIAFLDAMTARLKQKRDYELVQTWIAVFLRCHSNLVTESVEVREALRAWKEESDKEAGRVNQLVGYVRGVSNWIGGVV